MLFVLVAKPVHPLVLDPGRQTLKVFERASLADCLLFTWRHVTLAHHRHDCASDRAVRAFLLKKLAELSDWDFVDAGNALVHNSVDDVAIHTLWNGAVKLHDAVIDHLIVAIEVISVDMLGLLWVKQDRRRVSCGRCTICIAIRHNIFAISQ